MLVNKRQRQFLNKNQQQLDLLTVQHKIQEVVEMNSVNRRRMLNRRSAPRIMSLHQGVGISNAMTKEPISVVKRDSKPKSFNQFLSKRSKLFQQRLHLVQV